VHQHTSIHMATQYVQQQAGTSTYVQPTATTSYAQPTQFHDSYPVAGAQYAGTQVYPNNYASHAVVDSGVQYVDHGVQGYVDHSGLVQGVQGYVDHSGLVQGQQIFAQGYDQLHQVVHDAPISLEDKVTRFSQTLAATIQLLAPDNNPFTREVKVVKIEKEVTKTKVPVYTQVLVGGVQQLQLREQEISSSNVKLESYTVEVEEPRLLANGQKVNVKVKVEKFRPALTDDEYYGKDPKTNKAEIEARTFILKGVPVGADPSEFSADKKTLLSDTFKKALQDSIKNLPEADQTKLKVLAEAEYIVWGKKAGETDEKPEKK
jgi:hypothetical protein